MLVATSAQMRTVDSTAINRFGIPGIALMENAGRSVALKCLELLGVQGREDGCPRDAARSTQSSGTFANTTCEHGKVTDVVGGYGALSSVTFTNATRRADYGQSIYAADVACVARKVVVFAGKGSNGGDGFVVARYLHNWGFDVHAVLTGGRCEEVKGDARVNLDICRKLGVPILEVPALEPDALKPVETALAEADLVVDALLGTGSKGSPRDPMSTIIRLINDHSSRRGIPVVAVDLPSGVDADDASIAGEVVRATCTVTMGLLKRGLILFPGAEAAGDVTVADISLPREAVAAADIRMEVIAPGLLRSFGSASSTLSDSPESSSRAPISLRTVSPGAIGPGPVSSGSISCGILSPRKPDTHKGAYGHVLVVAGSRGFTGAAALAAMGALRVGAGLVTVACPATVQDLIASKLTEAMTIPLPDDGSGRISPAAAGAVLDAAQGKSVIAVGPGLGRIESVYLLIEALLKRSKVPLVIDADGLSVLEGKALVLKTAAETSGFTPVLTPHPGEMGRLLGKSAKEVQRDRPGSVQALAQAVSCVAVLKGARTLVSDGDRIYVNLTGNPGMASGGMGDVLTGMIAGFISQGASPLEGALLGVYLHGLAGDLALPRTGEKTLLATDLLEQVGSAIMRLAATGS